MKRIILPFFVVLSLSSCGSTEKSNTVDQTALESTDTASTAQIHILEPEIAMPELNIDDFELDYFKEVAKTEGNKNFSASPVSVKFALAIIANISDSILQSRIIEAMKYENLAQLNETILKGLNRLTKPTEESKMLIGNSLWLTNQKPINLGSRRDSLQKYLKATVENVDFNSPLAFERITRWGHQASEGNITPNFHLINSDCGFIATNLLYYAGNWVNPFDKEDTQERTFHKADSDTLVDMMYKQFYPRYYPTKQFKAVTLALEGGNSAIFILPKKGLTPVDILSDFSSSSLKRIINNSQRTEIKLSLPRFEISSQQYINPQLEEMGIYLLPSQFQNIGLPLTESNIEQLTKIKFFEEGVEAKAQTQMVTAILCAEEEDKPEPIVVTFDRPFIYLLRNDKTKSIIMAGIYAGPED